MALQPLPPEDERLRQSAETLSKCGDLGGACRAQSALVERLFSLDERDGGVWKPVIERELDRLQSLQAQGHAQGAAPSGAAPSPPSAGTLNMTPLSEEGYQQIAARKD